MIEYLVNHAVTNVWCSPEQDLQVIIEPARLTSNLGAYDYLDLPWERVALPTRGEAYHVFQIGSLHPFHVGLEKLGDQWKTLTDLINEAPLIAELYFSNGRMLPRFQCWLRYNEERNLLLAIKHQSKIPEVADKPVYLRLYTNAFYQSGRSQSTDGTVTDGLVVTSLNDTLKIQRLYHEALEQGRHALAYLNGYLVNDLIPSRVQTGDLIEYLADESVYRVVDLPVKDLGSFLSERDGKRKYLLHYPAWYNDTIDFYDDIDLYLFTRDELNRMTGVLYHRNRKDSIRMLTHKDYSIPCDYVTAYANQHPGIFSSPMDLVVRLVVRRSGYERPLIHENSRIHELYKLSDHDVRAVMLGVDANVSVWQAPALENSAYCRLMEWRKDNLDPVMVQQAYGYNAMARLLGDTPQHTQLTAGMRVVELPPAVRREATVYEYDEQGRLLGWHQHQGSKEYSCHHTSTALVEVIGGLASRQLDGIYGQTTVEVDPDYNYRVYSCTNLAGQPLWDWVDLSRTGLVTTESNRIVVDVNLESDYPLVLSDKYFLGYDLELAPVNGVLIFTINNEETHQGETATYVRTLPPRRLDLWMNGYNLIEGLDFHVRWPQVVIVNKAYLRETEPTQHITVRAVGFCTEEMQMEGLTEFGFVEHGYLSRNHRYDLRDDKVLSVVVDGRLVTRDSVSFDEDNRSLIKGKVRNGAPYCLREIVVPMRSSTYLDTYMLRKLSMDIDVEVRDYLDLKYPPVQFDDPSPIEERYAVYSPFLARIIDDIQEGVLDMEPFTRQYSNDKIYKALSRYEYLLEFDPAKLGVHDDYVVVHPHRYSTRLAVSIYAFNFLKRVIDLYFDGQVMLNHFLEVTLPTE